LPGSWRLLAIFEPFWSKLLESQKRELFTILEETYAAFTDWMAHFTISELLGVCFKDEQALEMLRAWHRQNPLCIVSLCHMT